MHDRRVCLLSVFFLFAKTLNNMKTNINKKDLIFINLIFTFNIIILLILITDLKSDFAMFILGSLVLVDGILGIIGLIKFNKEDKK